MCILTVETIRADPWSAVHHSLPDNADRLLLHAACLAAHYCVMSEHFFMEAARSGIYIPDWWTPDGNGPDVHEEAERCWYDALCKYEELAALYENRFGETAP